MAGETTTITPTLGKAYRSGAKTVDQLLVNLMDQFVEDAKAIDPTIIGAWVGRDMTTRGRDPGGAVQSVFLEREGMELRQPSRKVDVLDAEQVEA